MRTRLTIALAAAIASLAIAAPAQGAVTIGSSLATPNNGTNAPNCTAPCTATQLDLAPANQAPGGLRSPVNGTVTGWRFNANVGTTISLRVLRPVSGTTMTGVATSAAAGFPGPGTSPLIPTNLPIQVGDAIGLDNPNENFIFGTNITANALSWFAPPLANGETRMATVVGNQREVLVQAVVEPSNTLTIGKPRLNKKKGTAALTVTVPNAGQLSYSGGGLKVIGPPTVAAAGAITVTVKAKGKKAKKLRETGKVAVNPTFSFTPTNGTASSQSKKLKLKRKL